jgi:hypothetical protein
MKMQYEDMKIDILPSGMIVDHFIQGIGPYRYSDYLLEIVNETPFFLDKSKGESYVNPFSEAHGECDCISTYYELDFKLIASKSKLQAKSIFSPQIFYDKGVTYYCGSRVGSHCKNYRPIQATRIFAALRSLSLEDLLRIRKRELGDNQAEYDIIQLMKTLETDKNLFLFFPYNIYFDENNDILLGQDIAIQGIEADFRQVLTYRAQLRPNRDSYLCFLYSHRFVLTVWENTSLLFVDAIPIEKSPLFMKLMEFSGDMFSGDVLK